MHETIAFASGIGIHVQDCALEAPERIVVHDDRDPGGLETVTSSGALSSTEIRKPFPPQPKRWRTERTAREKSASDFSFAAAPSVMVMGALSA